MNRAEFAKDLLFRMGTVSNGYIADNYREKVFTWRNAISEAKNLLPPGYEIVANIRGREWRNHSYQLKRVPTQQGELF